MDDTRDTPADGSAMDLVFRALADPTRRAILDELRAGPRTTTQLVDAIGTMSRFGIMKHLNVLEEAHLIIVKHHGRERHNHLNAVPLRMIYERWVSAYEDHWAGSLTRLKSLAESETP